MSTPLEPTPPGAYADFARADSPAAAQALDPDDPPWGVGAAAFVWFSSIALMIFTYFLAVLPYLFLVRRVRADEPLGEALMSDPNMTLISVASVVPAHLATMAVVWAVVTRFGKRPFWQAVGWSWPRRFGFWASAGLALLLLALGMALTYYVGRDVKTPFDEMIESSAQALFATAFLATFTAPLVEEMVYRGVLFPALRRAIGTLWSVLIVAALFTVVHVSQYYNNPAVIAAVGSLGLALTSVRALTGRVLPCFVIHLVFNGVQCAALLLDYFRLLPGQNKAAALPLLHAPAALSALRIL